jgi:magnesium-transporting ATPase (P-type)
LSPSLLKPRSISSFRESCRLLRFIQSVGRKADDGRIIDSEEVSIDELALTGESLPVRKQPAALRKRHVPIGDRANMVYMGTSVIGGSAAAVVIVTGKETEFGQIQRLLAQAEAPRRRSNVSSAQPDDSLR